MNNLTAIKKAWAMGWSAILVGERTERYVVSINESGILFNTSAVVQEYNVGKFEITGYKYAGELAGNEPIPEGQKFKVKETGEIWKKDMCRGLADIKLRQSDNYYIWKNKSEIEPIFN